MRGRKHECCITNSPNKNNVPIKNMDGNNYWALLNCNQVSSTEITIRNLWKQNQQYDDNYYRSQYAREGKLEKKYFKNLQEIKRKNITNLERNNCEASTYVKDGNRNVQIRWIVIVKIIGKCLLEII